MRGLRLGYSVPSGELLACRYLKTFVVVVLIVFVRSSSVAIVIGTPIPGTSWRPHVAGNLRTDPFEENSSFSVPSFPGSKHNINLDLLFVSSCFSSTYSRLPSCRQSDIMAASATPIVLGQTVDHNALIMDMINSAEQRIRPLYPGDLASQPIGDGPFAKYHKDEFGIDMQSMGKHCGRAIVIWWLNSRKFGTNLSIQDVENSAKDFDALSLLKEGVKDITWKKVIPVHIDETHDMSEGVGKIGSINLNMLGLQKHVLGFLHSWHKLCGMSPTVEIPQSRLDDAHDMMKRAAAHVPVDFLRVNKTDPRSVWLATFQLTEDISLAKDELGHSAWDICVEYSRVAALTAQASGDSSLECVEQYLAKNVRYAPSSDYKCTGKSKSVEVAISNKKKLTAAGVESIMMSAKAEFNNLGPFCQMTKLTKMCQRCKDDEVKLRWVVSAVYLRLKTETMPILTGKDGFDNEVLRPLLELYDVSTQIPKNYCQRIAATRDVHWINEACASPLFLYNKFQFCG